jgi:C4-dicarboxylate-specific signal transduction histidine kinase
VVQFVAQAQPFLGGVEVNFEELDEDIQLPSGTFAEWSAVFQNVFANAANAMIDKKTRKISISSDRRRSTNSILIHDTGTGVDLKEAEKLFEPFERRIKISRERRSLSIGGSGLGLTIIRMIARNLGFAIAFAKPQRGFSTCLKIEWQER